MHPLASKITALFDELGGSRYGEEEVTQLQHALQCGQLAMQANAAPALIAAAFLHDIGHILNGDELPNDSAANLDDDHEAIGYQFLLEHFGAQIADPVRLHVVAKRYLCTTQPNYEGKLSPTSRKSFHDQGGNMSSSEIEEFESEPYFRDALQLRIWDDTAKDPQARTPSLEEFARIVETVLPE